MKVGVAIALQRMLRIWAIAANSDTACLLQMQLLQRVGGKVH